MTLTAKLTEAVAIAAEVDQNLYNRLVQILNEFNRHVVDTANPHRLHKRQLHLSRVQNFAPSTLKQAKDGRNNNTVMTPKRTMDFAEENIYNPLTLLFDAATNSIE